MKKLILVMLVVGLFATPALGAYGRRAYLVTFVDALHETNTGMTTVEVKIAGGSTATIYANTSTTTSATNPIVDSSTSTDVTTLTSGTIVFWYAGATCDLTVGDGTYSKTTSSVNPRNTRIFFDADLYSAMSDWTLLDTETMTYGTSLDWVSGAADSTMDWTPAADNSAFAIGTSAKTSDLLLYGGTANFDMQWDASRNTLAFRDSAILGFGTGTAGGAVDYTVSTAGSTSALIVTAVSADDAVQFGDATIATDVKFANTSTAAAVIHWDDSEEEWNWGADNTGVDVKFWGDGTGNYIIWDESIDTLMCVDGNVKFDDEAIIYLGTKTNTTTADGDVTISFNGSDLQILTTTSDEGFKIGSAADGFDKTYYFEDAGTIFSDYDTDYMAFSDDMDLRFGTGAGTLDGDFMISGDSAPLLTIDVVVAGDGEVAVGNDADDVPLKWYAETTLDWVYFNADEVEFEDVVLQIMDDTEVHFGDGDDGTLQYDEDGEDAMQWNNVAIYGNLQLVEIKTTSDTLLAAESGKVIMVNSSDAGGENLSPILTLPTAVKGLYFTFIDLSVQTSKTLQIKPPSGGKIAGGVPDQIYATDAGATGSLMLMASDTLNWNIVWQTQERLSWQLL